MSRTPAMNDSTMAPALSPSRVPAWGIALLLAAFAFVVFARSLTCDLVALDDTDYVLNPAVSEGLSARSIRWATTEFHVGYYIPVTWLSLMLDTTVFGTDAWGYHLTNVLLHAANTALLYLLLNRITGSRWRSIIICLLWAIHPLRVEAVTWVTSRKDVLSVFFGLLTLLAYVRYTKTRRLIDLSIAHVAFVISLLAKPTLTPMAVLLLLLDFWPLQRLNSLRDVWPRLREKLGFFALALASAALTSFAHGGRGAVVDFNEIPLLRRLANTGYSYSMYLFNTVSPTDLSMLHAVHRWPPTDGAILGWIAFAVFTAGVFYWVWRHKSDPAARAPLVGWLWFVIAMLPTCGFIQVGFAYRADRFTYVPAIGLGIALLWLVPDRVVRHRSGRLFIVTGTAAAAIALAVLTFNQIATWRDGHTSWQHNIRLEGVNAFTAMAYGTYLTSEADQLRRSGQTQLAQTRYLAAIDLGSRAIHEGSDHPPLYAFVGALLLDQNRPAEALPYLEYAAARDPQNQNLVRLRDFARSLVPPARNTPAPSP